MPIPTRPGVVGFFMSDPELTTSDTGRKRLFAWIGVQDPTPNEDGSYRPPVNTQLVMFNTSAVRAAELFRNGDRFIATGRVDASEYNGERRERFIASTIGPDNNVSTIQLQRGRAPQHAPEHDDRARGTVEVDPAAAALARREQELAAAPTAPTPSATPERESVVR